MTELREGSIYLVNASGARRWVKLLKIETRKGSKMVYPTHTITVRARTTYVCMSLATNRTILLKSKTRFIRLAQPGDAGEIRERTTDKALHLLEGSI